MSLDQEDFVYNWMTLGTVAAVAVASGMTFAQVREAAAKLRLEGIPLGEEPQTALGPGVQTLTPQEIESLNALADSL